MPDDEFYTRPVFCVRDVASSIDYYCDKLGFTKGWAFGGDKPTIAQVGRDGLDVILDAGSAIPRAAVPSVVSMSVGDLAALHKDLQKRGARITAPPFAVEWQEGICQFDVEDLDGNVLVFWGDRGAAGKTDRADFRGRVGHSQPSAAGSDAAASAAAFGIRRGGEVCCGEPRRW